MFIRHTHTIWSFDLSPSVTSSRSDICFIRAGRTFLLPVCQYRQDSRSACRWSADYHRLFCGAPLDTSLHHPSLLFVHSLARTYSLPSFSYIAAKGAWLTNVRILFRQKRRHSKAFCLLRCLLPSLTPIWLYLTVVLYYCPM